MIAWRACTAGALLLGAMSVAHAAAALPSSDAGEKIYRQGLLKTGAPLRGQREAGGLQVRGADAACMNCHQRSGLGTTEGRNKIPPVAGAYLFSRRASNLDESHLPYVEGMRADREPYTEQTLARAIREGVDSDGRPLSYLMPRFALGDADMAALIAYLKAMDTSPPPGVTDTVLHFATIVTPDADPVKRTGMLSVIEQYFKDKNDKAFLIGPSARMHPSGRTMYSKSMFMVPRRWQLHVWQLSGPASTWEQQLAGFMAREPVFAVISGLGGRDWTPVHRFCEREQVPCLFPNVEVPVDADQDFYSVYFSKGVLLEAELIAGKLAGHGASSPKAVHQIYRAGDSGEAAGAALTAALKARGIMVQSHIVAAGAGGEGVAAALRLAGDPDALVLWLRAADLAQLGSEPPARAAVYVSGLMGALERSPLPGAWRSRAEMTYPFDLPEKRRVRVDYPLGWLSLRHVPLVAEQVQADTYLACGLLSETINHLTDAFMRPYLVERLQTTIEHRIMTGYYPHLTLASNQRFASKGGYIVHFADASGVKVVPDSGWVVP